MVDYPGLDPASSVYRHQVMPVIIPLLIFVLSLPVLLSVLLWRVHKRRVSSVALASPQSLSMAVDASSASWDSALVQQLCGMFKESYWWMAPCIPARRLLLATLFAFMPSSSVYVWATLVNYLLLAIHLQLQPFRRAQDNLIESISLLLLSIQTSLLSGLHSPAGNPLLTVAMTLLLLPPPLMSIGPQLKRLNLLRLRWLRIRRIALPSAVGSVQMEGNSGCVARAPAGASGSVPE